MKPQRRLLGAARVAPALLALSLGLRLAAGVTVVVEALLVARIVDAAFLKGAALPELRASFWALAAAILARALLSGAAAAAAAALSAEVKDALRRRLLTHVLRLGPARLGGQGAARLAMALSEGVEGLEAFFKGYLPALAQAGFLPLLVLFVVFPIDWLSGLALLLTAPLIPMFMVLIGRWAEGLTRRQWRALSILGEYYLDALRGLATLKLFGAEARALLRIERLSEVHREATLKVLRVAFLSALVLELMATLATAIVAVEVGMRLLHGGMAFLPAFTVLLLAPEFYQPLRNLGAQFHAAEDAATAAETVFTILDEPLTAVPDAPLQLPAGALSLSFRGVSFGYPQRQVFENLDLEVAAGEFVALVGPSGAGKSTLVQLFMGFLQPQRGQVLAGGVPLTGVPPERWRRRLAWVSQDPFIETGSVRQNLLLARPQASDEELRAAAREAGALEFIERLPRGWDTLLGEDGVGLSGGQLQRLAVARAFLKDADVVFLDEPTAHLDPESEKLLHQALLRLRRGRTLLVVAHRLDAAPLADRVIYLQRGRVVCDAPHPRMIKNCQPYQRLWKAFSGSGEGAA